MNALVEENSTRASTKASMEVMEDFAKVMEAFMEVSPWKLRVRVRVRVRVMLLP